MVHISYFWNNHHTDADIFSVLDNKRQCLDISSYHGAYSNDIIVLVHLVEL
jgi:hypothetical protein